MTLDERTITLYVGGVAEIGDGCQFLLFDLPKIRGEIVGIVIPNTSPTVYQGNLIEIALAPHGTIVNSGTWKAYRINEGVWITLQRPSHTHDQCAMENALVRAYKALQTYQSKSGR